jgi:4-diphosphocytidyl-2-C-methyl-D-erythritol kinase
MEVWPAPAKLNLFLHVTGRRADGYHLLQTVFQFLDFGDELEFRITDDGKITRSTPLAGVVAEDDLSVRAARLLQAACGCEKGAQIHLRKRIPLGGGLGGGSSDAATTLLVLNRLWNAGRGRAELLELGVRLGADLPVFLGGHAAWGEGIGEVLTPVEPEEAWYVVVVPPVRVSTATAFGDLGLTGFSAPITIRDFHAGRVGNDLETAVRRRYPEVDRACQWLNQFGTARMTGAGGCVFLKVTDASAGEQILSKRPQWLEGFVTHGVNRHPLFAGRLD